MQELGVKGDLFPLAQSFFLSEANKKRTVLNLLYKIGERSGLNGEASATY